MNINEATGEVTLHQNQQATLRKAKNLIDVLRKVDPKVTGIESAIEKYCEPEAVEAAK